MASDYMNIALREASAALEHGDVPVGAVVVIDGVVVAARHNERELTGDPTAHAEVLAIRDAATATANWRLTEAHLYVTLEPCVMCAGAIVSARIGSLTFAAFDAKAGAVGSLYNVCNDPRLNHEAIVASGDGADESAVLLKNFFLKIRDPKT